MSIETVRDLSIRLTVSAGALLALGLALDERATGAQLDPAIKAEVDNVLSALGAGGALDDVSPAALGPMSAEIRTTMLFSTKLLMDPTSGPGWSHTDDALLVAAGEVSAGFPLMWKSSVVPRLDGLAERLEAADGAFLDVGVGIGALSTAMATLWPSLRVVGVDLWRPSLEIARERVRTLGLDARVELREQAIEDLPDVAAFDLIWFTSFFIGEATVRPAIARMHRALRPGGWVLFSTVNPGADPLSTAYVRLRTVIWGGRPWVPGEAEALLEQAGYTQVQTLASPPTALGTTTVGRRP
jgi:SAM-dependent methyltransferase